MAYAHDEQARVEANMFPLPSNRIEGLTSRVSAQRNAFGEQGVRGHRISYEPDKWNELLPDPLRDRDSISRSDVFQLAETGDLTEIFTACFVWGVGRVGYGPHRYREILNSTASQLDEMLHRAADAAAKDVISGLLHAVWQRRPEAPRSS